MPYPTFARSLLLCLLSGVLLTACQTEQASDTKVVAHKVINATAGMSGFKFDIPEGYHRVNPDKPQSGEEGMLKYYEQYVSFAKKNARLDYQESMLFSNGTSLIIFTLSKQRQNKPFSQMNEFEKTSVLKYSMADWNTYWNTKIDTQESGNYDSKYYAHTGFPLEDGYRAEDYLVLGSLRETYQFFGVSPENKAKSLDTALMTMVISLRY